MPRYSSTPRRSALRPRLTLAGLAAGFACLAASPALAQASTCQEIGKNLSARRDIVQKLQALGKAKKGMDPKSACSLFGDLVTNGTTAVKWLEANKDWCQIPDPVVENIKQDHARAVDLRGKACKAAAQQAAMEKKAKEGGSSGLLGGDGLTGSYRMPQGAL
jgi:hypothetical protein